MYAVVNTGGKQYKVGKGDSFRVEKLPGDVGSNVTFDKVLLFSDGETVRIGRPYLDDMKVSGHIVEQGKGKKIIVFKYKKRKRYKRKQGHRQPFTLVKIDGVMSGDAMLGGSAEEAETSPAGETETVEAAAPAEISEAADDAVVESEPEKSETDSDVQDSEVREEQIQKD